MSSDRIDITLAGISTDRRLRYENYQALSLMQALLGSITPNMLAISIRCIEEAVHLHFYLEQESASDREEIADIETEVAALEFTDVPIFVYVAIVGEQIDANTVEGRLVYRRYAGIDHSLRPQA
jgi:hypothetical protein